MAGITLNNPGNVVQYDASAKEKEIPFDEGRRQALPWARIDNMVPVIFPNRWPYATKIEVVKGAVVVTCACGGITERKPNRKGIECCRCGTHIVDFDEVEKEQKLG